MPVQPSLYDKEVIAGLLGPNEAEAFILKRQQLPTV